MFAWNRSPAWIRRGTPPRRGRGRRRPGSLATGSVANGRGAGASRPRASKLAQSLAQRARARPRSTAPRTTSARRRRAAAGGRRRRARTAGSAGAPAARAPTGSSRRPSPYAEIAEPTARDGRGAGESSGHRPQQQAGHRAARTGPRSRRATLTGSEPISAPPPAQRPISANGRASSRTSSAAALGRQRPRERHPDDRGPGWSKRCIA